MIRFHKVLFLALFGVMSTFFGSYASTSKVSLSARSRSQSPSAHSTASSTASGVKIDKDSLGVTVFGTGAGAGAGSGAGMSAATAVSSLTAENLAKAQSSGLLTKAAAGIANWCGKTRTEIFFDLHANNTFQADARTNPAEALRRTVDAIDERYTKDLACESNQDKIGRIFTIIESTKKDTGAELELGKALAKKYNEQQEAALKKILHAQATIHQPANQEEKEEAIRVANFVYDTKMQALGGFAAQTAKNKRYLELQLGSKTPFDYAQKKHYQNAAAHEALLASIRQELTSAAQETSK